MPYWRMSIAALLVFGINTGLFFLFVLSTYTNNVLTGNVKALIKLFP